MKRKRPIHEQWLDDPYFIVKLTGVSAILAIVLIVGAILYG